MESVVILSAIRTAVTSYGGSFKDVSAIDLGKIVMEASISKAGIEKKDIDEVIFGCVLQSGQGQNVARQCAVGAKIPIHVPAITINKICGSGLRSVSLGTQTIKANDNQIVIVGGTENMSQASYLLPGSRFGYRMGDQKVIDSMIKDGLWDAFNGYHMGVTAENVAEQYNLSREEQDEFALFSQKKAMQATTTGRFKDEIVPVEVVDKRGHTTIVDKDEYIRADTSLDKLAKLQTIFKQDGKVTAGNSSGINDGAAALVLAKESMAIEKGLKPMARIAGYASIGVDPSVMGLGPIGAIKKALVKANLTIEDIDLFEINEAFAAQAIAVIKELGIDPGKVNVNGGAIAIGHPIGASGARILVTLIHEMMKQNKKYGVASLCIGGGQGTAVVIENMMI